MRNPYDILGVKPAAGEAEIRKAYRKLAKQFHPDLNQGNAAAEARFKEIAAAYHLLSDPAKRGRFDRGEIDAEGHEIFARAGAGGGAHPGGFGFGFHPRAGEAGFHPRAGEAGFNPRGTEFRFDFGGGNDDVGDLFSHLFGDAAAAAAASRSRGRDRKLSLEVDFVDAATGARHRVALPDGRSLDVAIPAGITDGQVLRLKGQGDKGQGATLAGDLLVEVRIRPHPLFRRDGRDIRVEVPITLAEAVEGGRITVPTVTGKVTMAVPPGTNSGKVLRLKGKGIKGGDQYVTLVVTLPERIDDELAAFVRDWSRRHPYDPRAGA